MKACLTRRLFMILHQITERNVNRRQSGYSRLFNHLLDIIFLVIQDHTSYFMKYRLHLIDDEEFERELAENPPHACQPLMAKPRAKKAKK